MSAWLIDTLLATSLLMALVLVVRRPVAQTFGPGIAYALWLIPVARLFMPSLSAEQMSVAGNGAISSAVREAVFAGATSPASGAATVVEAAPSSALSLFTIALALWLGGAVVLFLVQMARYASAHRTILTDAVELQRVDGVRIISTPQIDGPLAFGIFRRYVAVPSDFSARFSECERELALAHELSHHRSGDLYANFAGFILLCLQWFNPLAWASWRAFRLDQEAACDARVLSGRSVEDRHLYGATLARAACGGVPAFATALNSPKTIVERLRRLTMKETSKRRSLAGKIALAAVVTISLPLTATTKPAKAVQDDAPAATSEPKVETKVVKVVKVGEGDNVRTVERDGKTYVFHTDKPLNDEEVEKKIVEADASMADADKMVGTKKIIMVSADANPAHHDKKTKKIFLRKSGDGGTWTNENGNVQDMGDLNIAMMVPDIDIKEIEGNCNIGQPVTTETSGFDGKKKSKIKLVICGKGQAKVARREAVKGMKEARADVEADMTIPAKVKADVLANLDESIAKLEAQIGQD